MHTWAVLLAAGRGLRFAGSAGLNGPRVPKQFLPFEGAPLFWRSALTLSRLPGISGIVFVFPPPQSDGSEPRSYCPDGAAMLRELDAGGRLGLPWKLACGGARRQDSVASGLKALPAACEAVLIHDSARPFASATLMTRVLHALDAEHPAVIPGIAVIDTIKCVNESDCVSQTPDRRFLRAVQTPQGFMLALLRNAHARAAREGWEVTDDAMLMEHCDLPVLVVQGEEGNRKITTAEDFIWMQPDRSGLGGDCREDGGMRDAMVPCVGFGYDVHRYGGNRPFLLGGVPVPCDVRVVAHSDGDTLLHALMDAMLGCISAGDIGGMFPDADPAFDNIASGILLAEVLERTELAGLIMTHVDITVVAQTPRIAPHRQAIAANVAKLLRLPPHAVNVKATTEEKLGFTGEKKGIKVMAVVSGMRPCIPPVMKETAESSLEHASLKKVHEN